MTFSSQTWNSHLFRLRERVLWCETATTLVYVLMTHMCSVIVHEDMCVHRRMNERDRALAKRTWILLPVRSPSTASRRSTWISSLISHSNARCVSDKYGDLRCVMLSESITLEFMQQKYHVCYIHCTRYLRCYRSNGMATSLFWKSKLLEYPGP